MLFDIIFFRGRYVAVNEVADPELVALAKFSVITDVYFVITKLVFLKIY